MSAISLLHFSSPCSFSCVNLYSVVWLTAAEVHFVYIVCPIMGCVSVGEFACQLQMVAIWKYGATGLRRSQASTNGLQTVHHFLPRSTLSCSSSAITGHQTWTSEDDLFLHIHLVRLPQSTKRLVSCSQPLFTVSGYCAITTIVEMEESVWTT